MLAPLHRELPAKKRPEGLPAAALLDLLRRLRTQPRTFGRRPQQRERSLEDQAIACDPAHLGRERQGVGARQEEYA
jgi:hypothetical protein